GGPDIVNAGRKLPQFLLFVFLPIRRAPCSTLFPYTTLFRSRLPLRARPAGAAHGALDALPRDDVRHQLPGVRLRHGGDEHREVEDRKSTRLNSSHDQSSYAVFCLKKKSLSGQLVPRVEAAAV